MSATGEIILAFIGWAAIVYFGLNLIASGIRAVYARANKPKRSISVLGTLQPLSADEEDAAHLQAMVDLGLSIQDLAMIHRLQLRGLIQITFTLTDAGRAYLRERVA